MRYALRVEGDIKLITAKIMTYLRQHPLASDSLEGVSHWWLVQQEIKKDTDLVEQALEHLAREGKLTRKMNSNRESIYGLTPTDKPIRK